MTFLRFSCFLIFAFPFVLSAQNPDKAKELVNEGIRLHDKKDFAGAIAKYDAALAVDTDNFYALYEKAFSLYSNSELNEAVKVSEYTLKKYPRQEGIEQVYITLGNALDDLDKPQEAVDTYRKGIQARPGAYLLHFNLGLTYARLSKTEEALASVQTAALLHPGHASSHFIIGLLMQQKSKRIPAILALTRYLALEPASPRSVKALALLDKLMEGNVKKTGRKNIEISIDAATLKGKDEPDYFGPTEVLLDMSSAMDLDKKNRKKSPLVRFQEKMDNLLGSLEELQEEGHGYFWENYVPFFVALREAGHLEALVYLIHLTGEDKKVSKWLKTNENSATSLLAWIEAYDSEEK